MQKSNFRMLSRREIFGFFSLTYLQDDAMLVHGWLSPAHIRKHASVLPMIFYLLAKKVTPLIEYKYFKGGINMLLIVLYALLGLIVVDRIENEGHFDDYVEEHDLLCVSVDDRRRMSEIFYGVLIWLWPVVVIKSIVQIFL